MTPLAPASRAWPAVNKLGGQLRFLQSELREKGIELHIDPNHKSNDANRTRLIGIRRDRLRIALQRIWIGLGSVVAGSGGFPCLIFRRAAFATRPVAGGNRRFLVREEDVGRARTLIEEYRHAPGSDETAEIDISGMQED